MPRYCSPDSQAERNTDSEQNWRWHDRSFPVQFGLPLLEMCRAPEIDVGSFLNTRKCLAMRCLAPKSAEQSSLNRGTLHGRVHLLAGLSRNRIPSGKSG